MKKYDDNSDDDLFSDEEGAITESNLLLEKQLTNKLVEQIERLDPETLISVVLDEAASTKWQLLQPFLHVTSVKITNSGLTTKNVQTILQQMQPVEINLDNNIVDSLKPFKAKKLVSLSIVNNRIPDASELFHLFDQPINILNVAKNPCATDPLLPGVAVLCFSQRSLLTVDAYPDFRTDMSNIQVKTLGDGGIANTRALAVANPSQFQTDLTTFDLACTALMSRLEALEAKNVRIKHFDSISQLGLLKSLTLQQMDFIVGDFASFPRCLRTLQLAQCRVDLSNIGQMPPLIEINLANCGLSGDVLTQLQPLTTLKMIDLSGNQIEIGDIVSFQSLTWLNLAKCGLKKVPKIDESIVEGILMNDNCLESVCGLQNMRRLRSINLQRNSIKSIRCLASLPDLQKLDVSHNQICSISAVAQLQRLVELDARDNLIFVTNEIGYIYLYGQRVQFQVKLDGNPIVGMRDFAAKMKLNLSLRGKKSRQLMDQYTASFVGFAESRDLMFSHIPRNEKLAESLRKAKVENKKLKQGKKRLTTFNAYVVSQICECWIQ